MTRRAARTILQTGLLASLLTVASVAEAQVSSSVSQFKSQFGTTASNDLNSLSDGSTLISFGPFGLATISGATVTGGAIQNPGSSFTISFSQLINGFGADFIQPPGAQSSASLSLFNGITQVGEASFARTSFDRFLGLSSTYLAVPANSPFNSVVITNSRPGAFLRMDNLIVGVVATTSTVPEPATVALFGTGLLVVGGLSRRRKRTTG